MLTIPAQIFLKLTIFFGLSNARNGQRTFTKGINCLNNDFVFGKFS